MRATLPPRPASQTAVLRRRARTPAAVPPAQTPPARRPAARDDRLAPLLSRAVAQRAGACVLQRAVIALNGPSDSKVAKRITKNCLANLTTTKDRGEADGPADPSVIGPPDLAEDESLYILGHGNPTSIADLSPAQLGDWIVHWYGGMRYRGKIKLVACSSAVSANPGVNAPSYAAALASHLATHTTWRFHPNAVDGVLGVAWVDERSGRILMIDDPEYDRQEKLGTDVEGAFAEKDATQRQTGLTHIFGAADATGSSVHTGKGTAKVRFFLPPRSLGASLLSALTRLIPCSP